MSNESLSELYYEKINESSNPVPLFVSMMTAVFDINNKEIFYKIFARLYKVYSKEIIFFSILDCYDMENIDLSKPYGILAYFCKKRFENKYKFSELTNLDDMANKMLKSKKHKQLIAPKIFEDDNE